MDILSLRVKNRAGVLEQIAGQIRREGWNIKSLNVDEDPLDSSFSQMDIEIDSRNAKITSVAQRMLKLDCVVRAEIKSSGSSLVLEPRKAVDTVRQDGIALPLDPGKPAGAVRVLVINPGSTSTKLALYDSEALAFSESAYHNWHSSGKDSSISGQKEERKGSVLNALANRGVELSSIDAVVGRCGNIMPVESGVYSISDLMIEDINSSLSIHASSLGAIIAREIADGLGVPSYAVDPIDVDEIGPLGRLSGFVGIERSSIFHALNQKATAKAAAERLGKQYENCRLIVAHLGGGITVGAHLYGRVADVNDALNGEGPFTPERSGAVPLLPLIEMCFSGEYQKDEIISMVSRNGGMQAYLGTNDLKTAQKMIDAGDIFAATVVDTMAYQVSKEIGSMFAVLQGRCDAIVLTGGLAYSSRFTGSIKERVDAFCPVFTIPGELEMQALAMGALAAYKGECEVKVYE